MESLGWLNTGVAYIVRDGAAVDQLFAASLNYSSPLPLLLTLAGLPPLLHGPVFRFQHE
jgi:hypothetical protein